MTMLFNDSVALAPSPDLAAAEQRTRRVLIVGIGLSAALALPSVIALGLDDRLINGISVWSKPLKSRLRWP
jgi:hypothetical protein